MCVCDVYVYTVHIQGSPYACLLKLRASKICACLLACAARAAVRIAPARASEQACKNLGSMQR